MRVRDLIETADVHGTAREEACIQSYFETGDVERIATDASLEDLVIERVSMLAIEK